jgi:hypothetical protein
MGVARLEFPSPPAVTRTAGDTRVAYSEIAELARAKRASQAEPEGALLPCSSNTPIFGNMRSSDPHEGTLIPGQIPRVGVDPRTCRHTLYLCRFGAKVKSSDHSRRYLLGDVRLFRA